MIMLQLADIAARAAATLFGTDVNPSAIGIQRTNIQFRLTADFTVMVFPLTRISRKSPELTATMMGEYLREHESIIADFNVVKGFLNLRLTDEYWHTQLLDNLKTPLTEPAPASDGEPVMVEFSSPNTNKPLHLGHIRNNLLGDSLSRIMRFNGKKVLKVNLVNDRGIHICKSMLAWQKWGSGETPASSGMKGDKLVGKYYVEFDRHLKAEIEELKTTGLNDEQAAAASPLLAEVRNMLILWEKGNPEVRELWSRMNNWVYQGFEDTYQRLGISFDKTWYESETYLLGREIVMQGLSNGVLFKKDDGSVWIDLSEEGLDEKLLLRADGTSVYMTQDIGTACMRYEEFKPAKMIYVVGNEQNYHFEVLRLVLRKLGYSWADRIVHFSYGMVELPEGKMKSREGTVVDADDLMDEVVESAEAVTRELGKSDMFQEDVAKSLFTDIGLGGLKYFILKVDPSKNMLFNPAESIDFDGNTGPFIQYTHARICSLIARSGLNPPNLTWNINSEILPDERELLIHLNDYSRVASLAADAMSPALIANFVYELARLYNQFYQNVPVLREPIAGKLHFRLALSAVTARVVKHGLELLGINAPERM